MKLCIPKFVNNEIIIFADVDQFLLIRDISKYCFISAFRKVKYETDKCVSREIFNLINLEHISLNKMVSYIPRRIINLRQLKNLYLEDTIVSDISILFDLKNLCNIFIRNSTHISLLHLQIMRNKIRYYDSYKQFK